MKITKRVRDKDKNYSIKGKSISLRTVSFFTLCILTVYMSAILNSYTPEQISLWSYKKLNNELKTHKINEQSNKSYKLISVPYISQAGEYPTGCEVVSTSMILKYYGYNISVDEFIDDYLESSFLEEVNGDLYGPNPNEAFVGDPRSVYSYGCYAPVIVNSLNKILGKEHCVKNTTGSGFNELIENYIDKEIPVLVWTSINLLPTESGAEWYLRESGEKFQWISNEHCMVFVGYDKDKYYFNDPYEGNGVVGYDKKLVEKRFKELGDQSIVILNNKLMNEIY
ncbi:C39 family peptidase [Clostridium sp. UBA3061]|uniref:C39 family peptidase n=1 Tax=Clostridium sp. UBA3061 TaxID=1946353 RepID=UPI00321756EA